MATRTPDKAAPKASEKDMFVMGAEREFQTTLKLLENYPADQLEFRPAPKSQTARELMWTLVGGKAVADRIKAGRLAMEPGPEPPKTLKELIAAFKEAHRSQIDIVKKMSDAEFNEIIQVQSGPKDFMDVRRADAFWFIAMDGIHHRGQFSVYLRMNDARVPSIYGPSGDEPWG